MGPALGTIIAGTRGGVARIDAGHGSARAELGLDGHDVHCVAADPADPDLVFAGTWDHGLYVSRHRGKRWEPAGRGIAERRIISLAVSRPPGPAPGAVTAGSPSPNPTVYAGTEPANLYRSTDRGESWERLDSLHDLPSARSWFYPPRAGGQRVRSIAVDPLDPLTLYVGIEVGGVMRTHDGGATWQDHRRPSFEDSHALATHPAAPRRVYQGAAGGVALSHDRGDHWRQLSRGVRRRFVWGLAVDTVDPDLWYVSAAYSPREAHRGDGRANAAVYRKLGTDPWHAPRASEGLDRMPFALLALRAARGALAAGLDDGRILVSEDAAESWRDLGVRLPHVRALVELRA